MAELTKWPELEQIKDPIDVDNTIWAPVEIRFQVKPGPGETWGPQLAAACAVNGLDAPSPGGVASFREWETDPEGEFYCYAPAGRLVEGATMTLSVHPRDENGQTAPEVLWAKDFVLHVEDGQYKLEGAL